MRGGWGSESKLLSVVAHSFDCPRLLTAQSILTAQSKKPAERLAFSNLVGGTGIEPVTPAV